MAIYSGTKKVKEILERNATDIVDKVCGRIETFELEDERIYIIPEYQRAITWSAGNVQLLIDNLLTGSKLLGSITLSTCEEKKFKVMDGQQRLTVLLMLVTYLNKIVPANRRHENLCLIKNDTFKKFNEVLKYEFDYERMQNENKELYNEMIMNDPYNQKENLKAIWNGILERIDSLSESEINRLLTAILESDMTLIVNKIENTETKNKFCADYFIDMNDKNVPLTSVDIIKVYAFKDDNERLAVDWIGIQEKCCKLRGKVKYSREDLFFQYFICQVNKEIEYSISKLSDNYEIKEDVVVRGKKYSSGTHVWYMFEDEGFYSKLLEDLNSYLDFIKCVTDSEDGRTDGFKSYFKTDNGQFADETRITNSHSIINAILRNDDVVPKMMILKYFLEVLKPEKVKKNKYKIIDSINLIANVFTMSNRREKDRGRLQANYCKKTGNRQLESWHAVWQLTFRKKSVLEKLQN